MNSFHRHSIIAVLTFIGLVSANGVNTVNAEQRSLAAPMASTFRIRSQTTRGNSIITGHGTAFGINLSEFGYTRRRYLMTACHVVHERDGSVAPNLKIEMRLRTGVRWVRCRIVASDPKLDVAVLECETDLPVTARFADHDARMRDALVMIGSPAGVPLKAVKGFVTVPKRFTEASTAYVDYIHEGCSGGPLFDMSTQNVIGLCIAGIGVGRSEQMDPHTCLYVSVANMKRFLRAALRTGDGMSPRRSPLGTPRNCGRSDYIEPKSADRSGMLLP